MNSGSFTSPCAAWKHEGRDVLLEISGDWRTDGPEAVVTGKIPEQVPTRYHIDKLGIYDSMLPAFLLSHFRLVSDFSEKKPTLQGLPDNLRGLLELALSVPEENVTQQHVPTKSEIRKLGEISIRLWSDIRVVLDFIGESILSLGRFTMKRARFRTVDFWTNLQECGVQALPIVSLLSFLIGAILAFVGNVQLINFGANIFVADLVGIAMVREMGVMITAIIMSGRTGAAFAAHLGSMKANEEIDALRTFGFNPFDFLVLPRLLALILMMPLLTIYANIIGILGGMLVGAFVGIPPVLYWTETLTAVDMTNSSLGVIKSLFFGAAIAICGCMQGMHAGNSSAAVGLATTRAVVTAITSVIVLDSAFAAIFTVLDV